MTQIVFHGENAAIYAHEFEAALEAKAQLRILPTAIEAQDDIEAYRMADVIVGNRVDATTPPPERARLYQVCAAGYDRVDLTRLPERMAVCNCFGHEDAIAEYVMAAVLGQALALQHSDALLRQGDWSQRMVLRREVGDMSIGLLGYGHIGKAIARRAKAFGMTVHVANRSAVDAPGEMDRYFPLDALDAFYASCDFVVVSLPLSDLTRGLVGEAAFAAMRPDATLINVGRGEVVEEEALFSALRDRRIGGAVIDTWYNYPGPGETHTAPATLPFNTLPNIVMTPHNSAWTTGLVRRRAGTMAANVDALLAGRPLANVLRAAQRPQSA